MSHRNHQNLSKRSVRLPQNMTNVKRIRQGAALSQWVCAAWRRTNKVPSHRQNVGTNRIPNARETEATIHGSCGYRIIVEPPGSGFRHVLTPKQIHQRLAEMAPKMLVAWSDSAQPNDSQEAELSVLWHAVGHDALLVSH